MFETNKNTKGILEAITKNWPKEQRDKAKENFDNYRPVVDDDAEEYVPKGER